MALWSRLYDGNRANKIFKGYIREQAYPQLFAKCYTPLQVDGTLGVTAGITEMLVQSHEGVIDLLPALPDEWNTGKFSGVCVRGGFTLNFSWENGRIIELEILSKAGEKCRINTGSDCKVFFNGKRVGLKKFNDGSIEFDTSKDGKYYFKF